MSDISQKKPQKGNIVWRLPEISSIIHTSKSNLFICEQGLG